MAPFRRSPAKVIAAAPRPAARATLVIPILPEPTARGSKPNRRPTRIPTGTDPIRYEIATRKIENSRVVAYPAGPERKMVGVTGFEPATPASRTQCSARLSYTPFPAVGEWEPRRFYSIGCPAAKRARFRIRSICAAHLADQSEVIGVPEDTRTRDENVGARLGRIGHVVDLDAAIDLDVEGRFCGAPGHAESIGPCRDCRR